MATKQKRRSHLHSVLDRLEERLAELQACEPRRRLEFKPVPKIPAIYLLSERGRPSYVGRTRNLRDRLSGHMRPGNDRYSATFAFRLAINDAKNQGMDIARPRGALEKDPEFQPLFLAAKERVSNMQVKYIEVEDPVEQTILEVYAAESLATPYNSFRTR